MKAEKIEFTKYGLFIDENRYGYGITKIEIENIDEIKIYVVDNVLKKDEYWKEIEGMEDIHHPKELIKYENIKIVKE